MLARTLLDHLIVLKCQWKTSMNVKFSDIDNCTVLIDKNIFILGKCTLRYLEVKAMMYATYS